jgi:LmbE family N-acetylglucosaminyl deacetylase
VSAPRGAPLEVPRRALAIGAHPDDIEFGAGGTLAKWAAAGCALSFLVLTDGSKGSWDRHEDQARLIARRQEEQRAAAEILGVRGEVLFGGWVDGELDSGVAARVGVVAAIRRLRPEVVLGHDPWKRYRLHPDHRHAGLLCTDGVVAARDPLYFPEIGPAPHRPSTILLFEADEVDHVEDVTASITTKVAALLAHHSQGQTTMAISGDAELGDTERAAFATRIATTAEDAAAGWPFPLGEAFKRIDDV